MADLIKLGMVPFKAVCSTCGAKTVRTGMRDHYKQYIHRCINYKCRHRMYRLEEHPVFIKAKSRALPLGRPWQMLQMYLHKNSVVSIRQNTGLAHATVERFCGRLRTHIQQYVFTMQDAITYGTAGRVVE
eukprot:2908020-Amphidinium_carterae.1